MKKFLLCFLWLLLASNVQAANLDSKTVTLRDSSNVVFTDYALTSGSAVQTKGVRIKDNAGFAAILVTENKSGGLGDVDIYAEYSVDNTNWYKMYVSDMAGTATVDGNIINALGNTTKMITFTARLGQYIRIVFDPDADSQVTAKLIYLEDR